MSKPITPHLAEMLDQWLRIQRRGRLMMKMRGISVQESNKLAKKVALAEHYGMQPKDFPKLFNLDVEPTQFPESPSKFFPCPQEPQNLSSSDDQQ